MKKNLHPEMQTIEVTCTTCGKKIKLQTTAKDLKVDTCSNCHPFYTGKGYSSTKDGRIDKFNRRYKTTKTKKTN